MEADADRDLPPVESAVEIVDDLSATDELPFDV